MKFSEFNLNPTILKALEKVGYTEATPIQEQVIQAFESGRHIVGQSQTGTGKTAAFAIPLINQVDTKLRQTQVLILAPTRELAMQTNDEFFKLSYGTYGCRTCTVCGGMSKYNQINRIKEWAQVVVGTPGRVIDLIEQWFLKTDHIKYLVLDEADRMLDMWFVEDVEYIRGQCTQLKQIMSFSATITNELRDILDEHIGNDYVHIKIATEIVPTKVDHAFIRVAHGKRRLLLDHYLEKHQDQKIVIFTQTKQTTVDVATNLHNIGMKVCELHGDVDQRKRNSTIKAFKSGESKILVATDVASRGLNLNDIDLVINYDTPQDPESYIHRIGRTARNGQEGKAITFVSDSEEKSLASIEKRNKLTIKEIDIDGNEVVRPVRHTRSNTSTRNPRWSYGPTRWGYRSWWYSSNSWSRSYNHSRNSSDTRTGWDRGYSSASSSSTKWWYFSRKPSSDRFGGRSTGSRYSSGTRYGWR